MCVSEWLNAYISKETESERGKAVIDLLLIWLCNIIV